MNLVTLFSGQGGPELAATWMGWNVISWTEINPFCHKILKFYHPNAEENHNIETTDYTRLRGRCDILVGGFPCQDASIAKQDGAGQQGLQGERTGLFYHMCRAIAEIRPKYVVAENVANILKTNRGKDFGRILSELSGMGYNAEWRVCRASEIGAPHHRARLYLVAYPDSIRLQAGQTFFSNVRKEASQIGWEFNGTTVQTFRSGAWAGDPDVLLLDDGFPYNVDGITISEWRRQSIKAAGNAIVPQVIYEIFKVIEEFENIQKP